MTICTQNREPILGDVVSGQMRLNEAGKMVHQVWKELPSHYQGIGIDEFMVMPNHCHGILILNMENHDVGAGLRARPESNQNIGQPQGVAPTPLSLPDIIHRFKSWTTTQYRHGVQQNGWPSFPGKLWQRNYYERIIRDENELFRMRQYIQENPLKWELDPENAHPYET